ncbi:MAG: aminotransferase class V-fold PLP-dependent enzyme [Clostridia bacterium]|nr:aminotransferase class V-fold PLP-dependent enzyme [Clostridia bacterium]
MFKKELRLVITEDCNYNCVFCHKEGMKKYERPILTSDDYSYLFDICKKTFGWDEVTLTGGEPFVRKDLTEIAKKIYEQDGKITIVTNGELLNKQIDCLKYIRRINLSLHSLDEKKYDEIIQKKDKLKEVLKNISVVRNLYPQMNIRLNSVIIKGQNDSMEQLKRYIDFAKRIKASIKFVELFSDNKDEIVSIEVISERLRQMGYRFKDICNISKQVLTDGETTIILSRVFCANALLQIDLENYCNNYNDLFITPEGLINICRNFKEDISIINEIKERNDGELIKKIQMALDNLGKNCPLSKERKKLAINGGIPVFKNRNEGKFIHPKITKDIEEAVVDQLHKNISIYDNSGIFKEFEENFAKYIGMKHAVCFSSGTAAIWAMFDSIGLRKNDEVICPSYTFFATVTPLLFTGAKPVLVDCDSKGKINVQDIKNKINEKTKAIIVTHMWGYPCDMLEIKKIAEENGIYLLEDCSHAHGAKYMNKSVGSWGDISVFSLQGQKIITGGEGGVLLTNNDNVKEKVLLLGHYNKRCLNEISKNSSLYKYGVTGKGMKLRAHPLAIRMANEYLKKLDEMILKKNEYVELITQELSCIDGIEIITQDENCKNSWYALLMRYNPDKMYGVTRERFVEALHKEGAIEVDIPKSTCPLNKLELFKNPNRLFEDQEFSYENKTFKEAENFYDSILKMPVWYTEEDREVLIKYIRAIKKVCKNIKELV